MQEKKILKIMRGSGLTSCLMVRLSDWHEYYHNHGAPPDEIDGSHQFSYYRDKDDQDVSAEIFAAYIKKEFRWMDGLTEFYHDWQYKWYDEIPLHALHNTNECVNPFQDYIISRARQIRRDIGDRTVVMYRGNDKCYEILRTPYQNMIDMANDSYSKEGYYVMTDENEFYDLFISNFNDTICNTNLPRIDCNPNKFYYPEQGKRVEFAMEFYATLLAMSSANKILMTTGNVGLTVAILRGTCLGIWQQHGNHKIWRRL